jgi:hypothetical protein
MLVAMHFPMPATTPGRCKIRGPRLIVKRDRDENIGTLNPGVPRGDVFATSLFLPGAGKAQPMISADVSALNQC